MKLREQFPREYLSYIEARRRSRHHHNYAGRGIKFLFESFDQWLEELGPKPDEGYWAADRIDNDGNYEPGNVKWSTKRENTRNQRKTVWLTYEGRTQCLMDWSDELGINCKTLTKRLRAGWSHDRVLGTPVLQSQRGDDGRFLPAPESSKRN